MKQNGSIELVVMGLLAALVVVLAIPLVSTILGNDGHPGTRFEDGAVSFKN